MTNFIKNERLAFASLGLTFVVLLALCLLQIMDTFAFLMAISLIAFFFIMIASLKFISYKKEMSVQKQLEDSLRENSRLREEYKEKIKEMEDYFILWIHQIKTPITAIKIRNEVEKDRLLDKHILEIENYTNLAMSYLKLTHPSTDLYLKEVTVDEMIAPLIKKYASHFIDSRTPLEYEPIQDLVVTDPNWTQLQIEQLLNNALKYGSGQPITIQMEGDWLKIQDQGRGIQASDLPKIFDKGYSGFNGQLNEKSSGLGLFIAQIIGKRLDQDLKVESVLGQGSTFSIRLHSAKLTNL